jgi:hypothetical protein
MQTKDPIPSTILTIGSGKLFVNLKVAEQKDENLIRETILPYLDRQIAAAEKKRG